MSTVRDFLERAGALRNSRDACIKVTPFAPRSDMGDEQVLGAVEKYIRKYFGKRGETVVQENLKCVREGLKSVMEIPWNVISAPAQPKAKTEEEVVFAK